MGVGSDLLPQILHSQQGHKSGVGAQKRIQRENDGRASVPGEISPVSLTDRLAINPASRNAECV